MVIRSHIRKLVLTAAFYAFAAATVGYFTWHAQHGDRGLKAKSSYKIRIAELNRELELLKRERTDWERRVGQMRGESLDRDLLDEQSRRLLNHAHRNDLIVILDPRRSPDGTTDQPR
jgi:cell division protein FtsB